MNRNRLILNIVLVIIIYFAVQFACAFIIIAIHAVCKLMQGQTSPESLVGNVIHDTMGWVLIVSSVITIALLGLLRKADLKTDFKWNGCEARYIPFVIVACAAGVIALDILNEFLDLPDIIRGEMSNMSGSVSGALAIALFGPVAEEVIFRGAICGGMLKAGVRPWTAIIVSAVIFGCVHLNPAQVPFAFLVGLMLAILYYKTGSLIPGTVVHILNNSWAVVMMNIYADEPDITFRQLLGQTSSNIILILGLSLSAYMFHVYWRKKECRTTNADREQ
ncbi:MAG: CPBP family intramembrane metalloprotease [Bacteroidaceae bacterium]|nr:CPBP family intramembrane metalloprotease [Bacteroidaceae bacterium]